MPSPRIIGRYALHGEIAAGGMATVHLGRLVGSGGVSRLVAIKRLHAQFAKDPEFVTMFLDEGRLSVRIHHPNVVSVLDFIATDGELFLVMEYVQGEALSSLVKVLRKREEPIPEKITSSIVVGLLQGLHAAHCATNERGHPLSIVHRDVSPQNVLVSVDGVARVLDFGVAKAAGRLQTTREGHIK
jgi:serine/threonine protein kinase